MKLGRLLLSNVFYILSSIRLVGSLQDVLSGRNDNDFPLDWNLVMDYVEAVLFDENRTLGLSYATPISAMVDMCNNRQAIIKGQVYRSRI